MNAMQQYKQTENEMLAKVGIFNAHVREFYAQKPGWLMQWQGAQFVQIAQGTVAGMEHRAALLNRATDGTGIRYAAMPQPYRAPLTSTWLITMTSRRLAKLLMEWEIQRGMRTKLAA